MCPLRKHTSLALFVILLIHLSSVPTFAQGSVLSYDFSEEGGLAFELEIDQKLVVDLSGGGAKEVTASVKAGVAFVLEKQLPDGDFLLGITFSELKGDFVANGVRVGDIDLSQVGKLQMSVQITGNGEVLKKFVAPINPQIDGTMRLLQDALFNALPIFSSKEVDVSDPWKHEKTSQNKTSPIQMGVTRQFAIDRWEKVGGKKLAHLNVEHALTLTNVVALPAGEDSVKGEGKGIGTAVFDATSGRLISAKLTVDFKSEAASGTSQRSTLSVSLSPVKP